MSSTEIAQQEFIEWKAFLQNGSAREREVLIKGYTSFANMLAAKLFASRQIKEIEFDEYKQYALIGLIESVDRYDPVRGVSFKTYAAHRIKGAVLSGIEKYCEKQQQITNRSRLREERIQNLLKEADKESDPFLRLVDVALGVAIGYMLEDSGMYQVGNEIQESNIYKSRELGDLVRVIERLVSSLSNDEEKVIRYHYYQQFKFEYIAEIMQLTKGRVSQIHHQGLRRIYEHYDELKLLRDGY